MPYSSIFEVEIRAATVEAVELMFEEIKKDENLSEKVRFTFQVDHLLWQEGEK